MGKVKYTIEDVRNTVENKYGWYLLDKEYKGPAAKYSVMCNNGHISTPQWNNLKTKKRTCSQCNVGKVGNNIPTTIEECKDFATNNNLILNSPSIENNKQKLNWTCKNCNDSWSASISDMRGRKVVCLSCGGWKPITIEKLQGIAESKGGSCLSVDYDPRKKQLYKCSNNHEFEKYWTHIDRGQWCPICSEGTSENIVRLHMETLFGEKFPKMKPNWLVTSQGERLELDGYCEKLGIAFEHHGTQHYEYCEFFHSSIDKFESQLRRDREKIDLCNKNNVKLIVVRELGIFTPQCDLKDFLKKQLIELNIDLPNDFDKKKINTKEIYKSSKLDWCYDFAKSKNGKIREDLMKPYLNINSLICIECENGTISYKKASLLKEGFFCTQPCCKQTGKHRCARTGRFIKTK